MKEKFPKKEKGLENVIMPEIAFSKLRKLALEESDEDRKNFFKNLGVESSDATIPVSIDGEPEVIYFDSQYHPYFENVVTHIKDCTAKDFENIGKEIDFDKRRDLWSELSGLDIFDSVLVVATIDGERYKVFIDEQLFPHILGKTLYK